MYTKSRGQEALEFALLAAVVFAASLFTVTNFSVAINEVFKNSPVNTSTALTNGIIRNDTSTIDSTVNVELDLGSGNTVTLSLPDTSFYTSYFDNNVDRLSADSNYTKVLAQAMTDISAQSGNTNLANLAKAMNSISELEAGISNYDTSNAQSQPSWAQKLDVLTGSDYANTILDVTSTLNKSLNQLNDSTYTSSSFSNPITGISNQDNYANKLQGYLTLVQNDPSLSSQTIDAAKLLATQAQTIASNNQVVVDPTAYDKAVSTLSNIASTAGISFTQLSASSSSSDKAQSVLKLMEAIKSGTNLSDIIANLPQGNKDALTDLVKSMQITTVKESSNVYDSKLAQALQQISD